MYVGCLENFNCSKDPFYLFVFKSVVVVVGSDLELRVGSVQYVKIRLILNCNRDFSCLY